MRLSTAASFLFEGKSIRLAAWPPGVALRLSNHGGSLIWAKSKRRLKSPIGPIERAAKTWEITS